MATDIQEIKLDQFRVRTVNDTVLTGRDGTLSSDGLFWSDSDSNMFLIPSDSIAGVYRFTGTKIRKGTETGLLIGLGSFTLLYITASIARETSDEEVHFDNRKTMMTAVILMVSGGMIGAMIGNTMENWEEVPLDMAFEVNSRRKSAQFDLTWRF